LIDLRENLLKNIRPASAKVGVVAPEDVILRKQVTLMEPSKTNFFAALNIATKITRGSVEILCDVKLFEKGKKIGSSESALLQMLDMKPFFYGPKVLSCFNNGSIFSPKILDFTETELFKMLSDEIGFSCAVSFALAYPNLAEFPKIVSVGFQNLVSVSLQTQYSFKQAEGIKIFLDNLSQIATNQSTLPDESSVPDFQDERAEVIEIGEEVSISSDTEEDITGFF